MALNQEEVNELLNRIKLLVDIHGSENEILSGVRGWYMAFCRCPEAGAFVALENEVFKIETKDEEFFRESQSFGQI